MLNGLASRSHRLVAVGLCYAALTAVELLYLYDWLTFARQVGLGLQVGMAAALIYAGVARSRQQGDRYGFPATH
jgi:hypothetical protein